MGAWANAPTIKELSQGILTEEEGSVRLASLY